MGNRRQRVAIAAAVLCTLLTGCLRPREVQFVRVAPDVSPANGQCRCGAAEVDITPEPGFAMAGHSFVGEISRGVQGHLFARALYLEDGHGRKAALCIVDLMSASRYLQEAVARRTALSCGIGVRELVLAGTHTHNGPGHYYGNGYFDGVAQSRAGFDRELAEWLAERIAQAVKCAAEQAQPAVLAFDKVAVAGVSTNRSPGAFEGQQHRDYQAWNLTGPGAGVGGSPAQQSVDPRLFVLAAFTAHGKAPIGVFATFGCHSTALRLASDVYSPDWPGHACRTARTELFKAWRDVAIVAIGLSAAGDANSFPDGLNNAGEAHAANAGRRIGLKVAEQVVVMQENKRGSTFDLEALYAEPTVDDLVVKYPARLSPDSWTGAPVLGGSEEASSILYGFDGCKEGSTGRSFSEADPQYPKLKAFGIVQELIPKGLLRYLPSKSFPLHILRIRSSAKELVIATVPGEPTAMAAWRIEQELVKAQGSDQVAATVIGYAGDYAGYLTTPEEYARQHYEGASMLYGAHVAAVLCDELVVLSTTEPGPPIEKPQPFDLLPSPPSVGMVGMRIPSDTLIKRIELQGPILPDTWRTLMVQWTATSGARFRFADGPTLAVEQKVDGEWRVITEAGMPYTDVQQPIRISRAPFVSGGRAAASDWEARVPIPASWKGRRIRVHVFGHGQFDDATQEVDLGSKQA